MKKIPENLLRQGYEIEGLTDSELSRMYSVPQRTICRLRKIYGIKTNPNYRLNRNPLRYNGLSDYQKQVLHGTLFGDSAICEQESGTGYWLCTHGIAQEQYLLKKAGIFNPFTANIFRGSRPFEKGGKEFPFIRARTFSIPQFTEYRRKFYPNGVKVITLDLLKEMTPIGMAFWWQDDGLVGKYSFNIVTYEPVFKEQLEEATAIFKKNLKLSVSITWDKEEGNICILRESHDVFWNYIKSEITPDLVYKLPQKYRI